MANASPSSTFYESQANGFKTRIRPKKKKKEQRKREKSHCNLVVRLSYLIPLHTPQPRLDLDGFALRCIYHFNHNEA